MANNPSVRSILITGGNGGIGSGIGRYFLERDEQARVWLGVRSNRHHAEKLADEFGGRVQLVVLEVSASEAWQRALESIVSECGRVDVLVNNAGGQDDKLLATMGEDDWHGVMSANLDAVFLGCRAVIPLMMRQRGGRIVNMASLSALLPPRGQSNYAAAKAGVVALTRSLAKEVARAGITVNAVLPGYIDTEALTFPTTEGRKEARMSVPMRRFGRPEEVAAAVYFLASAEAGYITGACVKIDGGIF